jgi:regulator of sigma E protease
MPGQAAEAAGIQAGDRIISIDDVAVNTWADIAPALDSYEGQPLDIVVLRHDQEIASLIAPSWSVEAGHWVIGIRSSLYDVSFYSERLGFFPAIGAGVQQSYNFTVMLISAIFGMATGQVEPDVGGPVAIVTVIGEATTMGMQTLLLLTAFLSINLAVINLLPLPALDGSRIVFLIIEALRGKPMNPEKEAMIHFVGLMILLGLIVLVTYNDIMRLLQ